MRRSLQDIYRFKQSSGYTDNLPLTLEVLSSIMPRRNLKELQNPQVKCSPISVPVDTVSVLAAIFSAKYWPPCSADDVATWVAIRSQEALQRAADIWQ
jgi:hypothetical protein